MRTQVKELSAQVCVLSTDLAAFHTFATVRFDTVDAGTAAILQDADTKYTTILDDAAFKFTSVLDDASAKHAAVLADSTTNHAAALADSTTNHAAVLGDISAKHTDALNAITVNGNAVLSDAGAKHTAVLANSDEHFFVSAEIFQILNASLYHVYEIVGELPPTATFPGFGPINSVTDLLRIVLSLVGADISGVQTLSQELSQQNVYSLSELLHQVRDTMGDPRAFVPATVLNAGPSTLTDLLFMNAALIGSDSPAVLKADEVVSGTPTSLYLQVTNQFSPISQSLTDISNAVAPISNSLTDIGNAITPIATALTDVATDVNDVKDTLGVPGAGSPIVYYTLGYEMDAIHGMLVAMQT